MYYNSSIPEEFNWSHKIRDNNVYLYNLQYCRSPGDTTLSLVTDLHHRWQPSLGDGILELGPGPPGHWFTTAVLILNQLLNGREGVAFKLPVSLLIKKYK